MHKHSYPTSRFPPEARKTSSALCAVQASDRNASSAHLSRQVNDVPFLLSLLSQQCFSGAFPLASSRVLYRYLCQLQQCPQQLPPTEYWRTSCGIDQSCQNQQLGSLVQFSVAGAKGRLLVRFQN